jgi:hypothetical protein
VIGFIGIGEVTLAVIAGLVLIGILGVRQRRRR